MLRLQLEAVLRKRDPSACSGIETGNTRTGGADAVFLCSVFKAILVPLLLVKTQFYQTVHASPLSSHGMRAQTPASGLQALPM